MQSRTHGNNDSQIYADQDGWQIVSMGRMLYPGGPHALLVNAPGRPSFHAAWRFAESGIIISHIGAKCGESDIAPVNFTHDELSGIQEHICLYAMRHAEKLFGETVTGVEFRTDDPMVEIF